MVSCSSICMWGCNSSSQGDKRETSTYRKRNQMDQLCRHKTCQGWGRRNIVSVREEGLKVGHLEGLGENWGRGCVCVHDKWYQPPAATALVRKKTHTLMKKKIMQGGRKKIEWGGSWKKKEKKERGLCKFRSTGLM